MLTPLTRAIPVLAQQLGQQALLSEEDYLSSFVLRCSFRQPDWDATATLSFTQEQTPYFMSPEAVREALLTDTGPEPYDRDCEIILDYFRGKPAALEFTLALKQTTLENYLYKKLNFCPGFRHAFIALARENPAAAEHLETAVQRQIDFVRNRNGFIRCLFEQAICEIDSKTQHSNPSTLDNVSITIKIETPLGTKQLTRTYDLRA